MKVKALFLAGLVGCAGPMAAAGHAQTANAPSEPRSSWFAEDKLKHFFASFVVSSLSASATRAAGLGSTESIMVGAGVGVAAGLIKERHDARNGGVFSGADLVWDAAGVGGAVLLLRNTR